MAKRSSSTATKTKKNSLPKVGNPFKNPTAHTIFGGFLILTAIFFFLSFTSYFKNWQIDQSTLDQPFFQLLSDENYKVKNILGKLGAALGHQFVFRWFGLASFLFVWLFLISGSRIVFNFKKISVVRSLKYSIFYLLWVPTFMAFVATNKIYGGSIGYLYFDWLAGTIGKIGAGLFLGFSLLAFLTAVYKITPEKIRHYVGRLFLKLASLKKKTMELKTEMQESFGADKQQDLAPPITTTTHVAPVTSEIKEPVETPVNLDLDINTTDKVETKTQPLQTTPKLSEVKEESEDEVALEVTEVKEDVLLIDKEINAKLKEFGAYDPTLDLSRYKFPGLDLLHDHGSGNIEINEDELQANKERIVNTLKDYKIEISKINATIGPTVTLYEIIPAAGVRISKIKNLEDDIALSLSALGIRIIAPIPGRGTIGIEVPRTNANIVSMRQVIASEKFQKADMELPLVLGKTISNETFVCDLAKMPHLLMAGATGQGKSVGLNCILTSLLYKKHPSEVKFVLVDPKKVELTLFNKIERHFLAKLPGEEDAIITDTKKVVNTLNSLCIEMDQRYDLLKDALCRNIKEYNVKFVKRKLNPENGHRYLPYIVLVIDEFADLIMTAGKEVETPIARLAQLARAIGIHLIVATQRPSVNVITGIIKANFPARIAFRVTSKIDSRTILDAGGADQLIGRGDMLISLGSDLIRVQCAFVDTPEVEAITDYIGTQQGYSEALQLPEYSGEESAGVSDIDASDRDTMFREAASIIVMHQQGSASLLQRKLKVGYNRAGRMIDQLEAAGIIGQFEGSKARQVLVPDEMALEQLLNND
ncbi:MAG: S-DNA-T family DNA segregation ATPase FtsK/SpoIIIE [Flavobacteriales bacterium]|jgi:S-DNA-T family DNA segregation ATPase FtsK/SpoIIIE